MSSFLLIPLIIALAFSAGFAIRRGSICAVAATRQWVVDGHAQRMRAFLIAGCWAGAVLLPFAWLAPETVSLSPGYSVSAMVFAGGALFGLGAYINGACAFGTLAHIAGGDTEYLGTVVGVVTGAVAFSMIHTQIAAPAPSPVAAPTLATVIFASLLLTAALIANRRGAKRTARRIVRRLKTRRFGFKEFHPHLRLRPAAAIVIIGVAGGLLHGIAGEWTYMSVLSHRAQRLVDPTTPDTTAQTIIGAVALVAGGVFAATRANRFQLRRPKIKILLRCILGGLMMSVAAATIPGGNDVLLVYGAPSVAPHALAAYAAMTATLALIFFAKKRVGAG